MDFFRRARIGLAASWATLVVGCQLVPYNRGPSESEETRQAKLAAEIQGKIESFGGVPFRKKPLVERMSTSQRCAELDSVAKAGFVARKGIDATPVTDQIWQAAGILKPGENAGSQRSHLDCLASRSLYQVEAKRILLFVDSGTEDPEHALAHEMVHALQDERIDLVGLFRARTEPDEITGVLGAVEGQAEFVAGGALETRSKSDDCRTDVPGALWQLDQAIRTIDQLAGIPPSVSLPAYVPYVFGERLACRLREEMGAPGLDTLLQRPPRGSWQLLRYEDYASNRAPVDWDTSWSGFPALPGGWKPLGQARTGEARLAGLPLTWDRSLARTALAGKGLAWQGDRLWVAQNVHGGTAIFWRLAFQNRDKAKAFAQLWWSLRGVRLKTKLPACAERRGTCDWINPRKVAYFAKVQGSEVGIAEGLDSLATRQFLAKLLSRKPMPSP